MATRIKEKAKARAASAEKRPFAKATYIRISPYKVAIVMDTIRGKNAQDAVAILENLGNASASAALKVLLSAIANAENNKGLAGENLFVAECFACPGPTMKRVMVRARGRADQILKRSSHITIVLDEKN